MHPHRHHHLTSTHLLPSIFQYHEVRDHCLNLRWLTMHHELAIFPWLYLLHQASLNR
jgi:hypothetical protein